MARIARELEVTEGAIRYHLRTVKWNPELARKWVSAGDKEIPPSSRNDGTMARVKGEGLGDKAAQLFSSSPEPASHSERSEETQKDQEEGNKGEIPSRFMNKSKDWKLSTIP